MVRCRKQHKGKEKVVRACGKRPHRAHRAGAFLSGAPVVANWVQVPLSVEGQRRCAAGAPGLALWVPHPLRALTIFRNFSGALLVHWESDLPADHRVEPETGE